MSEETKIQTLNEETMTERGRFTANGYTFTVEPVYLGEEKLYLSEMKVSPIPSADDKPIAELTDKELGSWAIAIFNSDMGNEEMQIKKPSWLSRLFNKIVHHNDYHYYNDSPQVQPLIKWIERKVTYNGNKIHFYDLERKFGLNKAEIEKLFVYFHEISNF